MVPDFYSKVDISSLTAYTKVDFGDMLDGQSLLNGSGVSVDVSFDGTTQHGNLAATGISSALTWERHKRGSVWLKRTTSSGGGPLYVEVYGWRELR